MGIKSFFPYLIINDNQRFGETLGDKEIALELCSYYQFGSICWHKQVSTYPICTLIILKDSAKIFRGLWDEDWVIGGGFSICRFEIERYNCIRRSSAMSVFSDFIQDMGLIDLPLQGAFQTWTRNVEFLQASRIDRFLVSSEQKHQLGTISQIALPKVASDHCPLALDCGDWSSEPSDLSSRTCGCNKKSLETQ